MNPLFKEFYKQCFAHREEWSFPRNLYEIINTLDLTLYENLPEEPLELHIRVLKTISTYYQTQRSCIMAFFDLDNPYIKVCQILSENDLLSPEVFHHVFLLNTFLLSNVHDELQPRMCQNQKSNFLFLSACPGQLRYIYFQAQILNLSGHNPLYKKILSHTFVAKNLALLNAHLTWSSKEPEVIALFQDKETLMSALLNCDFFVHILNPSRHLLTSLSILHKFCSFQSPEEFLTHVAHLNTLICDNVPQAISDYLYTLLLTSDIWHPFLIHDPLHAKFLIKELYRLDKLDYLLSGDDLDTIMPNIHGLVLTESHLGKCGDLFIRDPRNIQENSKKLSCAYQYLKTVFASAGKNREYKLFLYQDLKNNIDLLEGDVLEVCQSFLKHHPQHPQTYEIISDILKHIREMSTPLKPMNTVTARTYYDLMPEQVCYVLQGIIINWPALYVQEHINKYLNRPQARRQKTFESEHIRHRPDPWEEAEKILSLSSTTESLISVVAFFGHQRTRDIQEYITEGRACYAHAKPFLFARRSYPTLHETTQQEKKTTTYSVINEQEQIKDYDMSFDGEVVNDGTLTSSQRNEFFTGPAHPMFSL